MKYYLHRLYSSNGVPVELTREQAIEQLSQLLNTERTIHLQRDVLIVENDEKGAI